MASKNMMNDYRRPIRLSALNILLTHALSGIPGRAAAALALALDVKVFFRGGRLGDIDRVGRRKGLLQPLLGGLIQQALLAAFGILGVGARSAHGVLLAFSCPREAILRGPQAC